MINGKRLLNILQLQQSRIKFDILKVAAQLVKNEAILNSIMIEQAVTWRKLSFGSEVDVSLIVDRVKLLNEQHADKLAMSIKKLDSVPDLRKSYYELQDKCQEAIHQIKDTQIPQAVIKSDASVLNSKTIRKLERAIQNIDLKFRDNHEKLLSSKQDREYNVDAIEKDKLYLYLKNANYSAGNLSKLSPKSLFRSWVASISDYDRKLELVRSASTIEERFREWTIKLKSQRDELKREIALEKQNLGAPVKALKDQLINMLNRSDELRILLVNIELMHTTELGKIFDIVSSKDASLNKTAGQVRNIAMREQLNYQAVINQLKPQQIAENNHIINALDQKKMDAAVQVEYLKKLGQRSFQRYNMIEDLISRLHSRSWDEDNAYFDIPEQGQFMIELCMGDNAIDNAWQFLNSSYVPEYQPEEVAALNYAA